MPSSASTPVFKHRLSAIKYKTFQANWDNGLYRNKRLGEAFYNFFSLHCAKNQPPLIRIFEADGETAKQNIDESIEFV